MIPNETRLTLGFALALALLCLILVAGNLVIPEWML